MAIAFDVAADLGNNGGATNSLTAAFNNVAGNLLVVSVTGDTVGGNDDITGVTYNGVSMTLAAKLAGGTGDRNEYVYYLVSPATGSHNVVVSATNTHYLLVGAASYTGANTTGQPDATNTRTDTTPVGGVLTVTITTVTNNDWTVLLSGGANGTASTGETARMHDGAFAVWAFFDSGAAVTPAGSYGMTTSFAGQGIIIRSVLAAFAAAAAAASADWSDYVPPAFLMSPRRTSRVAAMVATGLIWAPSQPSDLRSPVFGYDLAPQPLMSPAADRAIKISPSISGPTFVAAKPADLLPPRLGWDLAPQPLLSPGSDRVIKGAPQASGPTFVTAAPGDLRTPAYGYELINPPFIPSANRPWDKGAALAASGPYFVIAPTSELLPLRFGYDAAPQPLARAARRVPIPDAFNLHNVLAAPPASFTWSADPVLSYTKPGTSRGIGFTVATTLVTSNPSDLLTPTFGYDLSPPVLQRGLAGRPVEGGPLVSGLYFVISSPGDLQAPAFGYDLAPSTLARAVRPPSIVASTGTTLVLSKPGDLLPLTLGYELTAPALARARRRVPLPDTLNEPSVLVVITIPTAYGYDPAPQPFLSAGRLHRSAALLGQPLLVLSQPSDLRTPLLGYDLTPAILFRQRRVNVPSEFNLLNALVAPSTFVWSSDPTLFLGRAARRLPADVSFTPPPTLVDVWGFALTPGAPLTRGLRGGAVLASGPAFVAASPGDIARLALGYELTSSALLPVPRAPRAGGQFALPVFVPVAALDLRAPDYGYDLTPGLYTLLRAVKRDPGLFLQNPLFVALLKRLGFLLLTNETLAGPGVNRESLVSASIAKEDLQ